MDIIRAMQCFCRVVETGSFAAAARVLDCSPSMVTKQVKLLETWTNARLIARTTRSVQLTDAGQGFYVYCQRMLQETEAMLAGMKEQGSEVTGRLVIAAPVSLTLGYLGAKIQDFALEHPGIQLEVRLSDRLSDLVREGVDVALRARAQLEDSSLIEVPLWHFGRVLIASDMYLASHEEPRSPDDLGAHNCLRYVLGSDASRWAFTDAAGRTKQVEVTGNFTSDSSLLLLDAVTRHRGIALIPEMLTQGRPGLRRLLPDYAVEPRTLHAVYPNRSLLPAKTVAFVNHLRKHLTTTVT